MNDPELTVILDAVSSGQRPMRDRTRDMQRLIRDAEQAHRPWARVEADAAELDGYAKRIKSHMKATCTVTVRKHTRSTVIGVPRVVNGEIEWHQVEAADATFAEMRGHLDMLNANARALRGNIRTIERLISLEDKAPGSSTVGQALGTLHTTIEEVLAA